MTNFFMGVDKPILLEYIKFIPRPKKDGLHESGYRFIKLVGVTENGEEINLGEWHDHLFVDVKINIDVEPDGTIRIMPRHGERFKARAGGWYGSTAWIEEDGGVM